jgi:hypothetical protein
MIKVNKESLYWVPLMRYFYDETKEDDIDVMEAWYNYVFYFLPTVNKAWRDATSSHNLRNKRIMFPTLFVSDEALVQWFIEIQLPKVEENYIIGFDKVGKNYGKGKHDIKENSERYSILHQQISQRRKKYECALRWNQLFWMEVEKRHEAKFKNRNESNSPSKTSLKKTLPLPDMNEEEDIFEMYKKIKTNNDEIQPDEIGSTISL